MTTVTCAAYQEIGGTFTNKVETYRFTYDFANDTGAATHSAYYLGRFKKKGIILRSLVHVETACTSTGSATMEIGTTTDVDCILTASTGAVASLVDDAVLKETAGQATHVHVDDYLYAVIGTEALTAGKVHVILDFMSAV